MTVWFNLTTTTKRLSCQEDTVGGLGTADFLLERKLSLTDLSWRNWMKINNKGTSFFLDKREKVLLMF